MTSGSRASTIGISRCFSITAASDAVASDAAAAARPASSAAARSRAIRPAASAGAEQQRQRRQREQRPTRRAARRRRRRRIGRLRDRHRTLLPAAMLVRIAAREQRARAEIRTAVAEQQSGQYTLIIQSIIFARGSLGTMLAWA